MATFGAAIDAAVSGYRIRRTDWPVSEQDDAYAWLEMRLDLPGMEPTLVVTMNSGRMAAFTVLGRHMADDQWQVLEDY